MGTSRKAMGVRKKCMEWTNLTCHFITNGNVVLGNVWSEGCKPFGVVVGVKRVHTGKYCKWAGTSCNTETFDVGSGRVEAVGSAQTVLDVGLVIVPNCPEAQVSLGRIRMKEVIGNKEVGM